MQRRQFSALSSPLWAGDQISPYAFGLTAAQGELQPFHTLLICNRPDPDACSQAVYATVFGALK